MTPASPNASRWARACVVAGVVLIALTAASVVMGTPPPCGALASGYPPIIAFELARSAQDLAALFGDQPGACRSDMIAAMDTANVVDLAVFIPAYGGFLVAFFFAMRAPRAGTSGSAATAAIRAAARPTAIGAGLGVVAALADVVENTCLFGLTPALDPTSGSMALLPWATGVKWLALGAAGAAGAVVLARRGGRAARVGAVVCAITPIATVAAMVDPARFGPFVSGGVAASWLVFVVTAAANARRR